jgi:hypothetical protein
MAQNGEIKVCVLGGGCDNKHWVWLIVEWLLNHHGNYISW